MYTGVMMEHLCNWLSTHNEQQNCCQFKQEQFLQFELQKDFQQEEKYYQDKSLYSSGILNHPLLCHTS